MGTIDLLYLRSVQKYECTWITFLAKKVVLKLWEIADLVAFYKKLMNSRRSKLHEWGKK